MYSTYLLYDWWRRARFAEKALEHKTYRLELDRYVTTLEKGFLWGEGKRKVSECVRERKRE